MELKGTIANNCSDATVRTGTPNCDRQMGKPMALAVTPVNALYPIEADTFLENLEGYISDEGGMRLLWFDVERGCNTTRFHRFPN